MKVEKTVHIFTDGACRGNPGPGGWGAILRYDAHEKKICGSELYTTNNRMELQAVISALAFLTRACRIELTTDSQYVRNGVTQWMPRWKKNNWKGSDKKPVKNRDLWEKLDQEAQRHVAIEWHWVKGHSGHAENTIADALANHAIEMLIQEK